MQEPYHGPRKSGILRNALNKQRVEIIPLKLPCTHNSTALGQMGHGRTYCGAEMGAGSWGEIVARKISAETKKPADMRAFCNTA